MATCHACPPEDQFVPDYDMLDHLRVHHPDLYGDGPERWPDGQVVIHDMTLAVGDFTGKALPADEHHYDVSCDDRPYCEIPQHHAVEDMP